MLDELNTEDYETTLQRVLADPDFHDAYQKNEYFKTTIESILRRDMSPLEAIHYLSKQLDETTKSYYALALSQYAIPTIPQ